MPTGQAHISFNAARFARLDVSTLLDMTGKFYPFVLQSRSIVKLRQLLRFDRKLAVCYVNYKRRIGLDVAA